jgi:hypothetical protein
MTLLEGIFMAMLICSIAITVDISTEKYYLNKSKPLESIQIVVGETSGKMGFSLIKASGSIYRPVPCSIYAATLSLKNKETQQITIISLDHIHLNLSLFDGANNRTPVDLSVHRPKNTLPGIYTLTLDAIYKCSYGMLSDRKHQIYTSNEFELK